jgi:uncharacterized membrane protein YgdD (TMEM256/DUF423 family)
MRTSNTLPDPNKPARTVAVAGALLVGLAVALGAFGAHGLRELVTIERVATWETGARYLAYHGIGLLWIGLALHVGLGRARKLIWAARLIGLGCVLFCGSLFALVLLDLPILGAVAPLGGVSFMAGWVLVAWSVWKGA